MYKDLTTFVPFTHEDSDSKNKLINFARNQDTSKVEGVMAATLIYTNLVDYLAQHLLENLRKMIAISSYKQFKASFYFDPSESKNGQSLGNTIRELGCFGFADKDDFLKLLTSFNKVRIKVIHELMKLNLNANGSNFDTDLANIKRMAEDILAKYNIITSGIADAWQKIIA